MGTEHDHQVMLIRWFDIKYPNLKGRLYANPNGGARHIAVAKKIKAEGGRVGIPDLTLPVPRGKYHGLYIEMKSDKGRLSDNQKDWLKFLNDQGYIAVDCYGFDEAKEFVEAYLKEK